MSDDLDIKVKTIIEADEAASAQRIKSQLPNIENSLKSRPLKIPVEADASEVAQSVDQTVKAATNSLKGKKAVVPISAAFNIDLKDTKAVQSEVDKLVKQFIGNKGGMTNLKIDTSGFEKAKKVVLTYQNDAAETIKTVLKLKQVSEELGANGEKIPQFAWTVDASSYEKNFAQIEKAMQKFKDLQDNVEKLKTRIQRNKTITDQFDFFKVDAALDAGDIKTATAAFADLNQQYDLLKIKTAHPWASVAIENLPKQLSEADTQVSKLLDSFTKLQLKGVQVPPDTINQLKSLSAELQTMMSGKMDAGAVERFGQLDVIIKQITGEATKMSSALSVKTAEQSADTLRVKYERLLQAVINIKEEWSAFTKDPKLLGSHTQLVDDLTKSLNTNNLSQAGFSNLNAQFSRFRTQVQGAGKDTKTLFGTLLDNAKKFGNWLFVGGTIATTVRAVNDLFSNVIELNKAYTDLRIVTNGTDAQTKELLASYTALGERIGATTTEVASSASDWLRQGKSIAETNQLIEASMTLSKVGNIGAADSTQYLTSALRGYNEESSKALSIVDKLTSVDLVSASSAAGLAAGMSEVAASAKLAGVSMDSLLGQLASVKEVTQAPDEEIGHFFSSMLSRMGNIKLSKLDSYSNSGEDLNNVETVLSGLGIKLRDGVDSFRPFQDVLDETATKWSNYSEVQQRALATAFAPKQNMEKFIVLMENWGNATKYATVSANANGTAMQKMSVYTESVEAKQKKLTAATEGLSSALINSDLIKFSYDSGTGILGFLTDVIKSVGALPTLIAAASAALSFKNVGQPKLSGC